MANDHHWAEFTFAQVRQWQHHLVAHLIPWQSFSLELVLTNCWINVISTQIQHVQNAQWCHLQACWCTLHWAFACVWEGPVGNGILACEAASLCGKAWSNLVVASWTVGQEQYHDAMCEECWKRLQPESHRSPAALLSSLVWLGVHWVWWNGAEHR